MTGIRDAAKRLALKQPGGITGLAARMAVNRSTFYHKLDGAPGHNLFADEIESMTAITGDPEIAQYLAQLCNHICIPVGLCTEALDEDLFREFTALCAKLGALSGDLNGALSDQRISRNEERSLDADVEALIQAAAELRKRIHRRAARDAVPPNLKAVR